jgi:hypothetical protein
MASRFWVGGSGNWDAVTTTHWSASTGGSGGASVPTTSDTVTLDANSGSATVTITATANCSTFTSSSALNTLAPGANTINVAGGGATVWNWTGGNFTNGSSNIVLTGAGSTLASTTFTGGGKTYDTVTFSGGFARATIAGGNTFANLSLTATNTTTNVVFISATQIITGTLTLNGNSVINRLTIRSNTLGTTRTLTCTNLPTTNGFVDIIDITAGGAAGAWSNTGFGVLNATSITGASPVTTYYVGGTGNSNDATKYSSSNGGSANTQRAPLLQDTAIYNANSGAGALTWLSRNVGSVDFSNTALTSITYTGAFADTLFAGDFILSPSVAFTCSGSFADIVTFTGRGSQTLTTAGTTFVTSVFGVNTTGTYTLGSSLTTTSTFSLTLGTFTTNNNTVSVNAWTQTAGTLNLGSSTVNITGTTAGSTIWSMAGTLNAGTSNIFWQNTTASNTTFSGGGKTYNNLIISPTGAGFANISGSNTFNSLTMLSPGTKTVRHTAGTTTTLLTDAYLQGTEGNLITIVSTTAASAFTVTSSVTIHTDFIALQDSTAAGTGNPFYAGSRSTNTSGNTNWNFTDYTHTYDGQMMGMG